jgi:hypothetical protein
VDPVSLETGTRVHMTMALKADAVAYFHVLALAADATDSEQMKVLTWVASRIKTQAFAHLDFLDHRPVLETDLFEDYAKLAREVGDDEAAEWLETVARANRVHAERIEEVTT